MKSIKSGSNQEVRGLGDQLEKVFKVTGIDKVAKFILGEDCGCEQRRDALNRMFPRKKPECLNEKEYNYLTAFFKKPPNRINSNEVQALLDVYNRVFREEVKPTSCSNCFKNEIIKKLEKIYKEYKP